MDKFKQYKLKITEKNKDLVNDYLQEIQNIVDKYDIDKELYDDIEERLFEKLSNAKTLDELSIKKILKEIGEVEVIFADYVDSPTSFGEGLGLKVKEFSKTSKLYLKSLGPTLEGVIKTPLSSFMKFIKWLLNIAVLLVKKVYDFSVFIVEKIFSFVLYFLKNFMKYILPILRFVIFAFISFFLFGVFIALLVASAATFSSITFNNIDYLALLPVYTKWGFLLGTVSIGIFLVASIFYSFTGRAISKYWFIGGFIALVIMIFTGMITAFSLINTYGKFNEYNQVISHELRGNKDIVLDLGWLINEKNFPFIGMNPINLVNITGSTLKLDVKYKFLGNDDLASIFRNEILEPVIKEENGVLKFESEKIFSKAVPFIPFERFLTIYLPEGYTINFTSNYHPWIVNASFSGAESKYVEVFERYSRSYFSNCSGKVIWYSVDEEKFICELNEAEIKDMGKKYLEVYVIKNFDEISSITHKNEYKRAYWNDRVWETTDWEFGRFYWLDDDTLNIEFNDMSLDVRASLNVIETETGAVVSDFKINYVGVQEWIFKDRYYNNVESIGSWLPSNRETRDYEGESYN